MCLMITLITTCLVMAAAVQQANNSRKWVSQMLWFKMISMIPDVLNFHNNFSIISSDSTFKKKKNPRSEFKNIQFTHQHDIDILIVLRFFIRQTLNILLFIRSLWIFCSMLFVIQFLDLIYKPVILFSDMYMNNILWKFIFDS